MRSLFPISQERPRPAARPAEPPPEPAPPEFGGSKFQFTPGVRPGEMAHVFDARGAVLLTYRGFASVIGIVAGLVATVVLVAGVAAALFLFFERNTASSIGAVALAIFFALVVVLLVPATNVTLFAGTRPALRISQTSRSGFPSAQWTVATPGGRTIAQLRKSVVARLGRNRWKILNAAGKQIGEAAEESYGRALLRKFAGKFDPVYEADVFVMIEGTHVATIHRRPDDDDATDILEFFGDALDRRVGVALATLILGDEP